MVKKILHYMCDDKNIYTHVEDFVKFRESLRARGSTEPQEVAPAHPRVGAGRRRGR